MGDQIRFKQIMLNLLGNAVKFTEEGEVRLCSCVEELTEDFARIRVSIADTGIGIAAENLESIFAPFEQADTSIGRTFGGTGLGLAICRQFVGLMGGRIWAESEHTPIIALTAYSLKEDRERLLAGNFDGYLSKPLEVDQLMDLLASLSPGDRVEEYAAATAGSGYSSDFLNGWLESYPGIDLKDAMKRLDGDGEFYLELMGDFAKRYGTVTDIMGRALDDGDTRKVKDLVHTLKGVTSYLSLPEVWSLAERMELELAAGAGTSPVLDIVARLQEAIGRVLESMKTLIKQNPSKS
ncbi:MAG: response regulator [Geobacter sp.]|nr:MAG: response regulator [Geobacter sp.]